MADVIDLRAYAREATAAGSALDTASAGEKASLRFMASLMTFGPAATRKQIDMPVRREARRRSASHR
jgi:hypothetical protein